MHQRTQRHGAVHHAAGDDDVGACVQCSSNRLRAQVGVDAQQLCWHGSAAEHLAHVASPEFIGPGRQVVAFNHSHFEVHAKRLQLLGQCLGARCGVDTAAVGHDLDAA